MTKIKRKRPGLPPIGTRVAVATRQFMAEYESQACLGATLSEASSGKPEHILVALLTDLFGDGVKVHLDHHPPLIERRYRPRTDKPIASWYSPNAHEPAHLSYRVVRDEGPATLEPGPLSHHVKTHVRGENGQLSDTAKRVKQRRLDKGRARRDATRAGAPKKRRPARKAGPSRPIPRPLKTAWPKRSFSTKERRP